MDYDRAAQEIEDLRRDAERLTWMENNPRRMGYGEGYHGEQGGWFYTDEHKAHHDAPSLRAAIDAAMAFK